MCRCIDAVGRHKVHIKMILNESHFSLFCNNSIHHSTKLRFKLGFNPFDLAFIFDLHTIKYKVIKRVPSKRAF